MMEIIDTAYNKREDVLASSILKKKTVRIRAKPRLFRLPFMVYGAIITQAKSNVKTKKKIFRF